MCLGLGEHSAKAHLIQMLPNKQEGMAFTTQLWAIRLSLAPPMKEEGATSTEGSKLAGILEIIRVAGDPGEGQKLVQG